MSSDVWLAGVDGCPKGWVAVFVRPTGHDVRVRVACRFAEIVNSDEAPAIIAVDIPIGLPKKIGPNGRGPEQAIRPYLGRRRSSVFSVPSRKAVFAETGLLAGRGQIRRAHQNASKIARDTSTPSKGVSIQAFVLFPKIREVDAVVRGNTATRIFETHPELAFCSLNGDMPMDNSKLTRKGEDERRECLDAAGYAEDKMVALKGCRIDDVLDAFVCADVARRIHAGRAKPFPDSPGSDGGGISMAIWA